MLMSPKLVCKVIINKVQLSGLVLLLGFSLYEKPMSEFQGGYNTRLWLDNRMKGLCWMSQQCGRFITIEGTEGVGKSTNIEFIRQWLEARNIKLIQTKTNK